MMKLSRLFPLLALLLAASLHAENTHKEVRIASPWPAQNTIIAMLGYGDNIVGTSMIAKRIPLFRQSLPRIEKVAAVSVNSGHEINPEQIIALTMTVLESTLSVENRYRQLFRQRLVILAVIFIAIIASLLLDFTLGPSGLPLHSLIKTLMHPSGATNGMRVIVWDIRLPYALMALLVGMALGLAGAEMQTILNNSLASPFTLGVSSAAAFGAALAIVLGIGIPGVPESGFIPANAFLFALLSALLLDSLTRDVGRCAVWDCAGVYLQCAGVHYAVCLVFWTMGSLARASWEKLAVLAAAMAIVLPWSLRRAWQLTELRLGEERAMSFGIDVRRLRLGSLLRISLLAALSVAFVGPIGFIGLVAPHISRLLLGEDHRFYLPGSILIGGLVLSLASVASKNIIPGVILPVGIVTSLVGVPFFLSIVMRHRGSMS
ncbi:FecCD family ABC transporter permease [Escherichia coli]|nr:iron ABC transporter permease [Escherichia coli]